MMQLTYNGVALHTIGSVSLVEESSTFEPPEAPEREIVNLTFRVDVWKETFANNRAQMVLAQAAIRTPDKLLTVQIPANPNVPSADLTTLYCQHAKVTSSNFPSDVNEWGTTHQQLRISFQLEKHDFIGSDLAQCGFTPSGTTTEVPIGVITKFKEDFRVGRFSQYLDARESVEGSLSMSGQWLADMTMDIEDRRAALTTKVTALRNAFNTKSGILNCQHFNGTVKPVDCSVELDQAKSRVLWSFSCNYTRFPNEDGFAACDFEVDCREDEQGERSMTFSGRVMADTVTRAEAKLQAIKGNILTNYGMNAGYEVRAETRTRNISQSSYDGANDVGDTASVVDYPETVHNHPVGFTGSFQTKQSANTAFVELSFSYEYRKKSPTHLSWTLSVSDSEELSNGMISRSYSGTVTCGYQAQVGAQGSTTADQAFWIACTKARELGNNKYPVQTGSRITRDDRLERSNGTIEMVKVDFSFSYQVASKRLYAEMRSETQYNTFGEDVVSVSGSICGIDQATMEALYANLKTAWGAHVRNESKTWDEIRVGTGTTPALGSSFGPQDVMAFDQVSIWNEGLVYKLSFSYQYWQAKAAGAYAIKYGYGLQKDYISNSKTTTIEGSLFGTEAIITAAQNETGGNVLDAMISGLGLTSANAVQRRRSVDREYIPTSANRMLKLDFSESYEAQLSSADKVLECEVNESIQFSGDRNVVIDIPYQVSVVQQLGTTAARRTVSGTVTATNETTAENWAKKQRTLAWPALNATGGIPAVPSTVYHEPERYDIQHVFVPLTEGAIRGSGHNVKAVKLSFTFQQIVPNYKFNAA
jgi:hypothetical protein